MENKTTTGDISQEPKIFAVVKAIKQLDPSAGSMKIQKLLYYVQGWSLAWTGKPLFNEVPEAYKQGPVYPKVREDVRYHSENRVSRAETSTLTSEEWSVIASVVEDNRSIYGNGLADKTHQEPPWLKARGDLPAEAPSNAAISHEDMLQFFLGVPAEHAPKLVGVVGVDCTEPAQDFFERESERWAELLTLLSA